MIFTRPRSYVFNDSVKEGEGRRTTSVLDKAVPNIPRNPYIVFDKAGITRLFDFGTDPDHDRIFMII